MTEFDAALPQPAPRHSEHPPILGLVIQDIEARAAFGLRKYGTPLHGFNGRDALMDAYQETLDKVMYLRQALYERDCTAGHGDSQRITALEQRVANLEARWALEVGDGK